MSESMKIPEEKLVLPAEKASGVPEKDALSHFLAKGWNGVNDEGELLFLLLKASCFRELPETAYMVSSGDHPERNPFGVYHRRVTEQLRLKPTSRHGVFRKWGEADERVSDIYDSTPSRVLSHFRLIKANTYCRAINGEHYLYYAQYSEDEVESAYNAIGKEILARIFVITTRKYHYSVRLDIGWPDLMLWKDSEMIFREVKTINDKIRPNQAELYRMVFRELDLNYKILRLSFA